MLPTSARSTNARAPRKRRNPAANLPPEALPDLKAVRVTATLVQCDFEDGRTVTFPLAWSEKLAAASAEQRRSFEFNAHYIFWDDLDEIIGVRNILFGNQLYL